MAVVIPIGVLVVFTFWQMFPNLSDYSDAIMAKTDAAAIVNMTRMEELRSAAAAAQDTTATTTPLERLEATGVNDTAGAHSLRGSSPSAKRNSESSNNSPDESNARTKETPQTN